MSAQDDIKATEQRMLQRLESLAEASDNPKQAFQVIQDYIQDVQTLNEQRIAHVLETQTDEEQATQAIGEYQKGITQIEKIRANLPDFESAEPEVVFEYMEQSMQAMSDMIEKEREIGQDMLDEESTDDDVGQA